MRKWAPLYAFVIVLVMALKIGFGGQRQPAIPTVKKEEPMVASAWREIKTLEVAAKPEGLWTLALDHVDESTRLRFRAKGDWTYSTAVAARTTPDGDPASPLKRAEALLPDAPIGALIGKVGGSTAGVKDDGHMFVVGRWCVLELDDKTRGPLYLTINDEISAFGDNDGKVSVTIDEVQK